MNLVSPCSYQGGKQRVAKEIVDYILNTTFLSKDTKFYDLCCGSGAVTVELLNRGVPPENITMCDKSSWGVFWKSIGEGIFDLNKFYKYSKAVPRDKSLIQAHIKELSKTNADVDEEYKYILLQASSFGGKQICKKDWCSCKYFAKGDLYEHRPERIKEYTERFGYCECLFLGEDNMTAKKLIKLNRKFFKEHSENKE